jgi:hypothetical protein
MTNVDTGDIVTTHPRPTLLTTFTALLVSATQLMIKDDDYRKVAAMAAPFIALILMHGLKAVFKKDKCRGLIKIHKGWISTLEKERADPKTSGARKKEIAKEITAYNAEIKKLQMDSIDIKFT